ncbi:MAG: hypothetical protein WCO84_06280 [bacterium]
MKRFLTIIMLVMGILIFPFITYSQNTNKENLRVFMNDFTTEIKDSVKYDCNTNYSIGVQLFFTDEMKKYDLLEVEFYLYGQQPNEYPPVMYKKFYPDSKEFQMKYSNKDSIKLNLLGYSSPDFEINNKIYIYYGYTEDIIIKKICLGQPTSNPRFAILGFIKTGSHTVYDNNGSSTEIIDYDKGTELAKSIITPVLKKGKKKK